MANLMKMYILSFSHFNQMSDKVTFGTNTDNDRLATFVAKWHYPTSTDPPGHTPKYNYIVK